MEGVWLLSSKQQTATKEGKREEVEKRCMSGEERRVRKSKDEGNKANEENERED